MHVFVSQQVIH